MIAPDLRGFGQSDAPAEKVAYRIDLILGDILALLRSLEMTEPVGVIGHDWGAAVGWIFCMRHADQISRFAALSVGHPAAYRLAGVRRKLKGWYILAFQLPGLAEQMVAPSGRICAGPCFTSRSRRRCPGGCAGTMAGCS